MRELLRHGLRCAPRRHALADHAGLSAQSRPAGVSGKHGGSSSVTRAATGTGPSGSAKQLDEARPTRRMIHEWRRLRSAEIIASCATATVRLDSADHILCVIEPSTLSKEYSLEHPRPAVDSGRRRPFRSAGLRRKIAAPTLLAPCQALRPLWSQRDGSSRSARRVRSTTVRGTCSTAARDFRRMAERARSPLDRRKQLRFLAQARRVPERSGTSRRRPRPPPRSRAHPSPPPSRPTQK